MKRDILLVILCIGIALLFLMFPVQAAEPTTSVHIIKYASDGTTILNETTVTYTWMEANLPVQGDGVVHYYHQGPVFEGDMWDPDETENLKDRGAVKGTNIEDLCELAGGAYPGDKIKISAPDGYHTEFDYMNVYEPDPRQGPLVLTWWRAEDGYVPDYYYGMRPVFFASTTNADGKHVFGNWDMHECLASEYWHFWQDYPVTNGLSVKCVDVVAIYKSGYGAGEEEWTLTLTGAIDKTINKSEFEDSVSCHGASYTGSEGRTWRGIPLWYLMGWVDDNLKHGHGAFNDTLANAGYDVTVIAGDGSSKTFNSRVLARNENYSLACYLNGSELPEFDAPLKLVGSEVSEGDELGNVVKIVLDIGHAKTHLWGPYITGTTTDSTTINWKTENATTGTVKYATEGYHTGSNGYDHTITDAENKQLHHIAITNLTPNTIYHYQLIIGNESTNDHHFRTYGDGSYTFIVYGDTREQIPLFTQMERHKLVADRIAGEKNVSFVLHTGDFVTFGNDLEEWNDFFDAGRAMLANTTIYPVLGNHEDNHTNYYDAFGVPEWYSFDCGNAHFTILDSNDWASPHMIEQTAWLQNDLDSAATWKFVSFHHPIYSSDERHPGGWKNDAWENIFINNSVDAVFNGHVHVYERYLENGVQYVVLGCGGAPLYPLAEDKIPGYRNSFEHALGYAKITIDGEQATMDVIKVADISEDNKEVTHVYPPNTVFEHVVLDQSNNTGATATNFIYLIVALAIVALILIGGSIEYFKMKRL